MQYDLFFNQTETEVVVVERYKNSDALLHYVLMDAPFAIVTGEDELLGEPSVQLREAVKQKGVRIFAPYGRI